MTKPALKRIAQIFTAGTLLQKHQQISLFMEDGHSLLYSGDVSWKLAIPEADKVVDGEAESIDHALAQIMALLEEALRTLSPLTKVALAVEEKT